MPDQLFTYYIENPLVIISINSGSCVGGMVIRLDIGIWVTGKGGTERGVGKAGHGLGKRNGSAEFVALVCVWVDVHCCNGSACIRDCRGLGLCAVGTVG
jgi:hypothetical protein